MGNKANQGEILSALAVWPNNKEITTYMHLLVAIKLFKLGLFEVAIE